MAPVIGVTGPAGSGKSALAASLERYGFAVLSLDELGHGLLEQPDVKRRLVEEFSTAILRVTDGTVSRRKLADMVFRDPRDMQRLDSIVHPPLIQQAKEWIAGRRGQDLPGVVEGALVCEFGLAGLLDGVVVVDAPFDVRLGRLARSRGWDAARLTACDAAQGPVEEKIAAGCVPVQGGLPLDEAVKELEATLREKGWLPQNGEKT